LETNGSYCRWTNRIRRNDGGRKEAYPLPPSKRPVPNLYKSEQIYDRGRMHCERVDAERLHKITTEMQGLLDDLTRLLKRSGLNPVEAAGYQRRNDRLRELCKELSELA
jgi:hypothetical protein